MTTPDSNRLFQALDATWPAAGFSRTGPWIIRKGDGGGQRVSAATSIADIGNGDITAAEFEMAALLQPPIFMIRPNDDALDQALDDRGYCIVDPVAVYSIEINALSETPAPATMLPTWPPLAIQTEIWAAGGVLAPRWNVMKRAKGPKTTIIGRYQDRPVGTVFVACHEDIAMVHALEILPEYRRHGTGRQMMKAAAYWAAKTGARWMTLMVTRANDPANALYRSLGMSEVAQYHYRRADKADL
ncbi:MAG: GNAT family N-acetyltransferase [Boseongicola sp.]|nr:MAG: GNAT family N-acetyltransferase [Boseongicola sp.]